MGRGDNEESLRGSDSTEGTMVTTPVRQSRHPPQHSSTPDQSNVYFKYTTWTRPVALLGREGHLPAVSGTRRLLSRKHQQLPAYLVSESPGSQKRQEPRRLRAWRRSADRERLSWRVVERTFSAACAASLSAACSSSRSFRPSWTECRVLRGP